MCHAKACTKRAKYLLTCPTARHVKKRPGYPKEMRVACGQHVMTFFRALTLNATVKSVLVSVLK